MVLESYLECLSKAVHVVDFSKKQAFLVGRRVTNDITVSDISVSRVQSKIIHLKKRVFLLDNESKFGTFVMVKNLMKLHPTDINYPVPI